MKKLLWMLIIVIGVSNACTLPNNDDDDPFVSKTPVAIDPTDVGADYFVALWTSSDTTDIYELFVSEDRRFQNNVLNYPGLTGSSFKVQNLNISTRYYFRLNSKLSTNNKYSNTIEVVTRPYGPVADSATYVSSTAFQANWFSVDPIDYYLFQLATDPQFHNPLPYYDNIQVSDTTRYIHSLSPGTTYYYRVRAQIGTSVSAYSNTITVTTP